MRSPTSAEENRAVDLGGSYKENQSDDIAVDETKESSLPEQIL